MDKTQSSKGKGNSSGSLANHLPTEGKCRDEMKQIYKWSFEDAWKAQEDWESENKAIGSGQRGPFFRWEAAQELKKLYEARRAGDSSAIMEALYLCSLNSLPIPRWCEFAFLAAYRKVRQYKASSWDDVFGKPHPKGVHLSAKRDEFIKSGKVFLRVNDIKQRSPETPIDDYLFETVGDELGICKTLANRYYYSFKKRLNKITSATNS